MKRKNLLIAAALLGMFAVILGSFGAHALEDKLDSYSLEVWDTAVQYQFYHVLAMLGVLSLAERTNERFAHQSAVLFLTGILLFSTSLYLLALRPLIGEGFSWMGPVTPIGGLFFICGWVRFLQAILKTPSFEK